MASIRTDGINALKMIIKLAGVILLFTGSNFIKAIGGPDMFFCGDPASDVLKRFNRTTHDCINNVVKRKILKFCGLRKFNNNTHTCINSTIVEIPFVDEDTIVQRLPCRTSDILLKYLLNYRNKKLSRRQKCCGDEIYNQRFQTCCSSKNMHIIHDHKPEKDHVCCQLEVHNRRSAEASCHRSAHNDQFFKSKRLKRVNQKICKEVDIVYKVKVKQRIWRRNRRFLRVIVSRWSWNPLNSTRLQRTGEKRHMRVELDRYSGKRDLTGKSFLIFTDKRYSLEKVFQLRFLEKVYFYPKRKNSQNKLLKRVIKKCRKVLNEYMFSSPDG